MVNKAVFSYWNTLGTNNSSGYSCFRDMVASTCLAVCVAKDHFKETELITNDFGKHIFVDLMNLPLTSVRTDFNELDNLPPMWWGWAKVKAYSLQDKPFLHIDNDVYLWSKPNNELLNSRLLFQSEEAPFEGGYGWYKGLLERAEFAPKFPVRIKNNPVSYAYNCGIAGGNDLDIIKEWFETSSEYVLAPENIPFFAEPENMGIHQNLLHEQYFIASLSKQKGYNSNKEVRFLLSTKNLMEDCYKEQTKFTHLWGLTKKRQENMIKVYKRLYNDYPQIAINLKNIM